MPVVPFCLGLLLIILGVMILFYQRAPIEKWVGYNIAAAGILVSLESVISIFNQEVLSKLHVVGLITLCVFCFIIICGYGKFIEDY
ncbi:MAG: hypothetical protein N2484_11635 [Clostridia bacterium]|nr:hypothetical protein [Clostridia bacterium]